MKPNATLEDFQEREVFLVAYIKNQINKIQTTAVKYNSIEHYSKLSAYKDILYKLTKDDITTNS